MSKKARVNFNLKKNDGATIKFNMVLRSSLTRMPRKAKVLFAANPWKTITY